MQIKRDDEIFEIEDRLPLLPLRDVVLFPYMTTPLLVGRAGSVNAIEACVQRDRILFATAQMKPEMVDPAREDVHKVGTVIRILQLFRLPDGTMRVLVEGICRARVKRFVASEDYFQVKLELMPDEVDKSAEVEALMRSTLAQFTDYVHLNRRISDEVLVTVNNIVDPHILAYTIANHLVVKVPVKQEVLELDDPMLRLKRLSEILLSELEIVKLERKIEGQVRSQVHKNQKEFYLNEQLKAIRKELGYQNEFASEIEELERDIKKARMPREVQEKAVRELDRLSKMSFMSPEATVLRNYLDWLVALPWKKRSNDNLDLASVQKCLDEDHHGLKKIKERILEYMAIIKLSKSLKGPILCFAGPPGVGKTSLGKSIARALGRKFVRMSLGGVKDESEVRGHRRTYIGSMPGRIVQAMKKAGTVNPVILLDEVDKLGSDWRGDPSAALLEVLDPEQNNAFNDHYLEVDYDLSQVLFITTANYLGNIPPPLRDRMEIIQLPGYLENEKVQIARDFLVKKQAAASGLKEGDVVMSDKTLGDIVMQYTREAGVRSLEREIATITRKVARKVAGGEGGVPVTVTSAQLAKYLGPPKFLDQPLEQERRIGLANGLAWTEFGGDVMTIEVSILPGKGKLNLTGKLGDVMRESAMAALSYARRISGFLGLEKNFYQNIDIHIHVPEGAVPKDGPSAGITMAVALISALTGIPTLPHVAMTGEITLRGSVLPIGGLTEKSVAARRFGMKTLIVPAGNRKDLEEIPKEIRQGLDIVIVEHMDEVLEHTLAKTEKSPDFRQTRNLTAH
ncbi:MAG TPA: endopeptidase La [Candidatus Eisenbacteria bacterium]